MIFLAPCAYEPERINFEQSPSYSFGVKSVHDKPNTNPAPGAYEPEKVNLNHTPAYTFGSRFVQDKRSDTPGNNLLLKLT